MCSDEFNVEHYHNAHSTQYRCTHYTLLLTACCFQSVCNSVTPWCVIPLSTNSSPVVHPSVNSSPEPHHSPQPPAGTFSWNADCSLSLSVLQTAIMIMSIGETTSVNCGHQRAYWSASRWYKSMENHSGMMMSTEENTGYSTRALWQSFQ
jgi:hypothetical protein